MKIPRLIHQVYEDSSGPPRELLALSESWQKCHPGWEYILWKKDRIEYLLKEYYPEFVYLYHSFPRDIHRWDFIRYLILYEYGGLYVDMDYECLESLESILSKCDCYFGLEPHDHAKSHNKEFIVGNAFIASIPGHLFIKEIIDYINKNGKLICLQTSEYSVLESTGPFLITRLYNNCRDKDRVKLLPSDLVTPLTMYEVIDLVNGNITEDIENKVEKAYAIHYFMSSWRST